MIPTVIVAAAIATMVALGIWQLDRKGEKEAMLAQYAANQELPAILDYEPFETTSRDGRSPASWHSTDLENLLFREVEMRCSQPGEWRAIAGRNTRGAVGYAHLFVCHEVEMGFMGGSTYRSKVYAAIGWSQSPERPQWSGGKVRGLLAPVGDEYKVVAREPAAGLQALGDPDPSNVPNNHLAYAGQWFFFALTALVIYFLALRRRSTRARAD
ncbi:SURF1 family protein [Erythrobacter sp.]|uniref:SURF1 family protein n=1 Tax=Erythrobacter sp. TaxID=1042 RepID=UPI0025B80FE3|nr:SURF1 family cytochrome oxidase biogenesis protein [Erythrobacter sp.]